MQKKATVCLLLLIPAIALGCNRTNTNQGNISGQVQLDGKPVERGSIAFLPIEGTQGAATGGAIENGRYELAGQHGPAIGWNRVEIRSPQKTGRRIPLGFGAGGKMIDEETEAVAPQFNIDSTVKTEITPGDNHRDFNVAAK